MPCIMAKLKTIDELIKNGTIIKGKTVIVRVDLNVPMYQGKISDNTRIVRVLPTLEALIKLKTRVVVISHFGRPGGQFVRDLSLAPIADALSSALGGKEVKFAVDCVGPLAENAVSKLKAGEIMLLENVRFHKSEKENNKDFAKQLASLGDVYINDAFSCSHRSDASIVGITKHLPSAAGYLMSREIEHLESCLNNPERPLAAVVGGAKISSKINVLENLVCKADYLFIGGGMANTFLYAQGNNTGKSLCEKELKKTALAIIKKAKEKNCKIILPSDVVVAEELKDSPPCRVVPSHKVKKNDMILDVGPRTMTEWGTMLHDCKTIVWNGPLGAFEHSPFDVGTISFSRIIAGLTMSGQVKSVAGGGDVLYALLRSGLIDSFTYISTAGGAFLEWLEGKELPGIKVLKA